MNEVNFLQLNTAEAFGQLSIYAAAVVRIAAIVLTMPVVSKRVVPLRVKLALIVSLSILVLPSLTASAPAESGHGLALQFSLGIVNEALLGAVMGLSLTIMLAAAQLVGSVVEGLSGISMSAFGADPDSGDSAGPCGKLFWWTCVAVFLAVGGLEQVVESLLVSFQLLPAGTAAMDHVALAYFGSALGLAFRFGLSACLPAIAALLIASVVLGMVQRNFPQLGGMQVGLGIKVLSGMMVTSIILVSVPWLINGGFDTSLESLLATLQQISERN